MSSIPVRPSVLSCVRMDQEFYRRHSVTEMKEDSGKTLSAAARRSFFRRKQKHKRSSSKDSKETVALDAISTDSIPFLDGERRETICCRLLHSHCELLLFDLVTVNV